MCRAYDDFIAAAALIGLIGATPAPAATGTLGADARFQSLAHHFFYMKKLGSAFTLEKFQDSLLAHGDPPIPLLRPFVLGSADDGKPL